MYINLKELFKNNPNNYDEMCDKLCKKLTSKDSKERAKAELTLAKYNMEVIQCGGIF